MFHSFGRALRRLESSSTCLLHPSCPLVTSSFNRIVLLKTNPSTIMASGRFSTGGGYAFDAFTENLMKEFEKSIPKFTANSNKGANGRVAIIGGSSCYCGAPYFAAISALKAGCDVVYVFTSSTAAVPIKCYSPELIVYPILEDKKFVPTFEERISAFSSIVIGPGLGRPGEVFTQQQFDSLVEQLKAKRMPLVLDADALFFLTKNPSVIQGYKEAIITPNFREFKKLYQALFDKEYPADAAFVDDNDLRAVAVKLGCVTVFCKNAEDKMTDGTQLVVNSKCLGPRRCGGQGDILAGLLGTFIHWTQKTPPQTTPPTVMACIAGSVVLRRCARSAFLKYNRGMVAGNIIDDIPIIFKDVFPNAASWKFN